MRRRRADEKRLLKIFKALANPKRIRILRVLARGGEATVTGIIRGVGSPEPTVSRNLNILKAADLVLERRVRRWVYYRVNFEPKDKDVQAVIQLATGKN